VVDLDAYWTVERRSLLSQSQHTPFLGMELPAKVLATGVRGRIIWELAR
jgi:dihydroorotase